MLESIGYILTCPGAGPGTPHMLHVLDIMIGK